MYKVKAFSEDPNATIGTYQQKQKSQPYLQMFV